MVQCHHCIAHPLVADRGDNFRIRRVAVSILDNLPQIVDGCLSSLRCGRGLLTALHTRQHVMNFSTSPWTFTQILSNVLSSGKWK
jgi:hypothetical protein